MDNRQILKARAVELAERAQRLRVRAGDTANQEKLDNCADELIRLENTERFETAQSALERGGGWSEEERSLAHEINSAWLVQQGQQPLGLEQVIATLQGWAELYQRSSRPEIIQAGKNLASALDQLTQQELPASQKYALNFLLEFLETMLTHLATNDRQGGDQMIQTIRLLRSMRDTILISRELLVDDAALLEADKIEDSQFDRLTQVRESLDEIYAGISQTTPPR